MSSRDAGEIRRIVKEQRNFPDCDASPVKRG